MTYMYDGDCLFGLCNGCWNVELETLTCLDGGGGGCRFLFVPASGLWSWVTDAVRGGRRLRSLRLPHMLHLHQATSISKLLEFWMRRSHFLYKLCPLEIFFCSVYCNISSSCCWWKVQQSVLNLRLFCSCENVKKGHRHSADNTKQMLV